MNILIVVAHPDDEVLGIGGTVPRLVGAGHGVRTCIMTGKAEARSNRPSDEQLLSDTHEAQKILGLPEPIVGSFENICLNAYPHLELVKFIEAAIREHQADTIFTHHPQDLNNDHYHTSIACQAAARYGQRSEGVPLLNALYFLEVLSSTDWSFPDGRSGFQADCFSQIGDTLDLKIDALEAYRGVMREFPHPRSVEVVRGLAAYRGGQAGLNYAEAFQTAFRRFDAELGA